MYLSQYERRSSGENSSRASSRFPPLFVCASCLRTLFFSSPSLSCVTSVRLRSHADASYRAAVCISSDILLLTALLTSCPSFSLSASNSPQRVLTRYSWGHGLQTWRRKVLGSWEWCRRYSTLHAVNVHGRIRLVVRRRSRSSSAGRPEETPLPTLPTREPTRWTKLDAKWEMYGF